jgi:predicted nucleotidyltransferase
MSTKPKDKELAQQFADRLRERLGDNLVAVTLFGSRARGTAGEGSDFDFIVQVIQKSEAVSEAVLDVEVEMMNEFEALFAAIIYSTDEWAFTKQTPLGWNVADEGISL